MTLEYQEGREAYADGLSTTNCPYELNGDEDELQRHDDWQDGYQAAKREDA